MQMRQDLHRDDRCDNKNLKMVTSTEMVTSCTLGLVFQGKEIVPWNNLGYNLTTPPHS